MPPAKSGTLIIGLGNQYRRDDAVGLTVARYLKEQVPKHVRVLEASSEGASLMESWKDADAVILIDAVHSGAEPGTLHRLDAHTQPMPSEFSHCSTHAFSAAEAIELARALGQLPPRLVVYGVEGKTFESGLGLSLEVEKAVQKVVERVLGDLRCDPDDTES
ncbi:MAG: hydrogenase maturation protease [Dehalococcoidia bacterium SM23_28_2]|nr:MAG: hydrogenase maturation protease [Dehalococcoidia bacterium SM23_28_2]